MPEQCSTGIQQPNNLPEGLKQTEIGPLPEDWEVVRLGEVANFVRGISWNKSEEGEDGVPVIAIPNVQDGRINYNIHYRIQKNIRPEKKTKAGDILLVGSSGSVHNVGRTAVIPETHFPEITFASFLIKVSPLEGKIIQNFLAFLLSRDIIDYTACSKRAADGKFNLQVEQLRNYQVPFPSHLEQQKIAQVLSTVQRSIEAQDKIISATRGLKKSLMHHLFTYGPVPENQVEEVPLKETEIGPMLEHWEVVRLGEVCEKPEYGYTASAVDDPVGPKLLRITDIQNGSVNWALVPFCSCQDKESEKYKLQSGDILFARIGATTGKTFLVTNCPHAVFASYLIRVRTKHMLSPNYLNHWTSTKTYWDQIDAAKGGRLKQGINIPVLKNLIISLPPLSEQQQIAHILSAVDAKIEKEGKQKRALQGLFKSLLHNLMTGKIRVNKLEIGI